MGVKRLVLLDTNKIIYAFDPGTKDSDKVSQAKDQVKKLLRDPSTSMATSPLIRFEVLSYKALAGERMQRLIDVLGGFENFEITTEIADLAAEIARCSEGKLEKNNFDVLHFATAKVNDLELLTSDKDFSKIETAYACLQTQYQTR